MDNSQLYERIMMDDYINHIRFFRNMCNFNQFKANGLSTIIDVGGDDYRSSAYL